MVLGAGLVHLECAPSLLRCFFFFVLQTETHTSSVSSAIRIVDCKRVFDSVTKPRAPTGIDKHFAIDFAIIRGLLRRTSIVPTGLMLRDAGGEQLARTLLERLTAVLPKDSTVLPAEGRQRVSFPSRAVKTACLLRGEMQI